MRTKCEKSSNSAPKLGIPWFDVFNVQQARARLKWNRNVISCYFNQSESNELYRLLCASINATDRPKTKQKNVSMLKNQIQNREQQYYIYECAMCIGARNHLLYTNAKHTTATVPMEKDIHLEMETDLYFYLLSHFFFFYYFTIYFSLCAVPWTLNIQHSTHRPTDI